MPRVCADAHGESVILLLGTPQLRGHSTHAGLTLIEQWNRKVDFWTDLPCSVVSFARRPGAEFRKQRRPPAQSQIFTRTDDALPRLREIETALQRQPFDSFGLHSLRRNVGQASRALPFCLCRPKPHQDVEFFAALTNGNFRVPERKLPGLELSPFAEEIEIGNVARLIKPARDLEGRIEPLNNRLAQFEHLLIGLIGVKSAAHAPGEIEHSAGYTGLGFLEARRGNPLAQRNVENIQEVHGGAELEIRAACAGHRKFNHGIEDRITEKAGLHQVRLRDAEIRIHGLQLAIVEQSNLHRIVGGQTALQERLQFVCCFFVELGAVVPKQLATAPFSDDGVNLVESRIERH